MATSYVIFPSLEERIEFSGLIKKFPVMSERSVLGSYDIGCIEDEIQNNPLDLPLELQNGIYRKLGETNDWSLYSRTEEKDLLGDDIFRQVQRIKSDLNDLALGTGYMLPNVQGDEEYSELPEFDKGELGKFEKYGFSSKLEMIMSLSAYRCREVIKWKTNQYEWVNSVGIRNIITACTHGDPKFFQYKEGVSDRVLSPFGNEVLFQPRLQIGRMTHVYHSHEPEFFATFFRYALELGVLNDIMGINGERFLKGSHNLPGYLGPYGDASSSGYQDFSSFLFRVSIPIGGLEGKRRNVHMHSFAPGSNEGHLEFKIGVNKELQIFDNSGYLVMQFLPEDAEYLLKGILHQCANGHGRTSKNQILELVKYYYSPEFQTQKDNLNL